jgi:hypothetical protein
MSYKRDSQNARRKWVGPIERYDLIQEGIIAVVAVTVLVVGINVLFGSPLVHSVSFQNWANAAPEDFVWTTLTELTGTSETATYGPPYNVGTVALNIDPNISQVGDGVAVNPTGPSQAQNLGPLAPQAWAGVTIPVNPPDDFVLKPLAAFATLNPETQQALTAWNDASLEDKSKWSNAALSSTLSIQGATVVFSTTGDVGPLPVMMSTMLALARSGALNAQSIDAASNTYSTNNTRSLLYIEDGSYLGDIASYYNLQGSQWGVMNEIGSWPGQPWLWWYAGFYNFPGWNTIGTDILAVVSALVFVLILLLLPFIPGLRNLPRWIPIYRIIWRSYYRKYGSSKTS